MKVKTSELTGPALDWAVSIAEGFKPHQLYYGGGSKSLFTRVFDEDGNPNGYMTGPDRLYSQKWEAGGPIIERERIRIDCPWNPGPFEATCKIDGVTGWTKGSTVLVSAMRCYVSAKLGDEVEIPKGLL